MFMKRDEDAVVRPPWEELEMTSLEDPAVSLADVTVTRSRAIKLAGAALAAGAFGLIFVPEADARRRKKKRRRRRRRRNRGTITPNPVNFEPTPVGQPSTENVTFSNNGTNPIYVSPDLGNPAFTLAPTFDPSVPIAPGASVTVPITFTPTTPGVQTGSVTLVDANGTTVATAPIAGEGVDVTVNP